MCGWLLTPAAPPIRGLPCDLGRKNRGRKESVSTTRSPLCTADVELSIMLRALCCVDGSSVVSGNLGVLALVAFTAQRKISV